MVEKDLERIPKLIFKHLNGKLSEDEQTGYDIVVASLSMPLTQIALNAGKEDAAVMVSKVQSGKGSSGYDATKDEIVEDMIAAGIIDPVKVTRLAVENAVSAAAILLTTEAAVADIPEPKKDKGEQEGDY